MVDRDAMSTVADALVKAGHHVVTHPLGSNSAASHDEKSWSFKNLSHGFLLGSTRASRVVFGALAKDGACTGIDAVFGEGAENHLRGRRCSPKNPNSFT